MSNENDPVIEPRSPASGPTIVSPTDFLDYEPTAKQLLSEIYGIVLRLEHKVDALSLKNQESL